MSKKTALLWVESRFSKSHLRAVIDVSLELMKYGIRPVIATSSFIQSIPKEITVIALPGWQSEYGAGKYLTVYGRDPLTDYKWCSQRQQLLRDAYAQYQPEILLTETWPYAKGAIYDNELLPLVQQASQKSRLYSLVMDIPLFTSKEIAAPAGGSIASRQQILADYFTASICAGDGRFAADLPATPATPVHYPGYFFGPEEAMYIGQGTSVLVSAGGGYKAEDLAFYQAVICAIPGSFYQKSSWQVLVGADCPAKEFALISQQTRDVSGATIQVQRNLAQSEFTELRQTCQLLITRGGYFAAMPALVSHLPVVVVPRPSSQEQIKRAARLRDYGMTMVTQDQAFAATLRQVLRGEVSGNYTQAVDMHGVVSTARFMMSEMSKD